MSTGELRNARLFNAIESALERMHRGASVEEQMRDIRERYPSPAFFLESNAFLLQKVGLRRLDAFYFSMIPALTRYDRRRAFGDRPRLNTLSRMTEYLRALFIGVHVECFYVVLLDARGYLMDAILIRKGTSDSAPFYLKEMLSLVVQRQAKAVVLSHNHPSGTLQPSKEDVNCTLRAMNAMVAMNVPMLDHVIIAQNHAVSMRDCGAVPSKLWALQAPDNRLLREWIDVDLLSSDNLNNSLELHKKSKN